MQKFSSFPFHLKHKEKQQLTIMIELNYYWTMIYIFIVGICYSSKSLYVSSHFIMEDEINESNDKDDNETLSIEAEETTSGSITNIPENRIPKIKRKVPINKTSYIEIEEEFERLELEDKVAKLLNKKYIDVDKVMPSIERLHQIQQIQRARGLRDLDAILMGPL